MQGDPETRHLGFPGAITESGRAGAGMVGTPSYGPEPVPSGAVPEVARVLEAGSWYEVLEVSVSATAEEIKRAHKLKSLGTHPDKVGAARNSGAHEASVRVNMVRASAGPNASGSTAQLPGCKLCATPRTSNSCHLAGCHTAVSGIAKRRSLSHWFAATSHCALGLQASLDTADQLTCTIVLMLAEMGLHGLFIVAKPSS